MDYTRCLELLQIIKQAIEQESFERLKSDFHLLELKSAKNEELYNFVIKLKNEFEYYQKDISSGMRTSSVRSEYGKVFRKCIELVQLSDLSRLNI